MSTLSESNAKVLLMEELDDLRHDLGKYIVLPVALLPRGAHRDQILNAVHKAIWQTRTQACSEIGAGEMWDRFVQKWGAHCERFESYPDLCRAVETALGLEALLMSGQESVERDNVQRILTQVRAMIERVIDEVSNGSS